MAIHWNGSAWRKVWTSAPYYEGDVSTSASNGLAVGGYGIAGVTTNSLAEHWNGRTWATIKTPKIRSAWLYGLDCATARACWAVGSVGTPWRLPGPDGAMERLGLDPGCHTSRRVALRREPQLVEELLGGRQHTDLKRSSQRCAALERQRMVELLTSSLHVADPWPPA
jgi:hypothetical protein